MVKILKRITISVIILAVVAGSFFYFSNQVNFSHGKTNSPENLKIEKGENAVEIGKKLEQKKLISNYIYFVFYVWDRGLSNQIIAGEYEVGPTLTIPEIAKMVTRGESVPMQVKITFPEGWNADKMMERLSVNGLPGKGNSPDSFEGLKAEVEYFQDKYNYDFFEKASLQQELEGYLFPDTYYFSKTATAEDIIKKMLDNFDRKMSVDFRQEIKKQGKTVHEIITMASIIEGEVRSDMDRRIVSGIFWNRIKNGQALQSCATLAYILGENKKQYSFEDTKTPSPYNTYLNTGLPPGPISNPGLVAIMAAIYPIETQYNYFLSDPQTGETIFSRTLDEHNANKVKYGL